MSRKEVVIKYKDNEYKQVLMDVKSAIMMRQRFLKPSGDVDMLKMYEETLKNCFDKEYKFNDFVSVEEVDAIVTEAISNQYGK